MPLSHGFVYVAEPMNFSFGAFFDVFSAESMKLLGRWGLTVFRASTTFNEAEAGVDDITAASIENVNRAALGGSSLLLARLPQDVPSLGVPMEIEAAVQRGIPVVVWADDAVARRSVTLRAMETNFAFHFFVKTNEKAAIDAVWEQISGGVGF